MTGEHGETVARRLDANMVVHWEALDPGGRREYEVWCHHEPTRFERRVALLGWALGEFAAGPHLSLGPLTLRDLADRYGSPAFGPRDLRPAIRQDRALGVRDDRVFGGGTVTFLRLSRGGRSDAAVAWHYPAPCRLEDATLGWLAMNPWESVSEVVEFLGRF